MGFTNILRRVSLDMWLILPISILLALGLLMLYSLGLSSGTNTFITFYRQLAFLPIGLLLLFIVSNIDYRFFYHYAYPLFWVSAVSLLLVLLVGKTMRGTTGWFAVGDLVLFQPVEMAKVLWVLWLAASFAKGNFHERPLQSFVLTGFHLAVLLFLIILQPDFGSGILLILCWIGFLLLLNFPKKYIAMIFIGGIAIAVLSWFFIFADYQKDRLKAFIDPTVDPLGRSYNVRQSVIAIGSGNIFGRGVAEGTQSQLRFLPESHTDFIFAVIGEELGFVGVSIVLLAWAVIFSRLYIVGRRATDNFARLFVAGFLLLIGMQTLINIAMNLGVFPVVGLGLPLVSYGRSSLLAVLIGFGIVFNISRKASRSFGVIIDDETY